MATKKPVKKAIKKPVGKSSRHAAKKPTPTQDTVLDSGSKLSRTRLRIRQFLSRRPHRSFRRTRRRDYVKPLHLPGYVSFTSYVFATLWQRKATYLLAVVFYSVLTSILVGVASQDMFQQTLDLFKSGGDQLFSGLWGEIGKAGLLLAVGVGGNFTPQPSEAQQIYGVILLLIIWLTTIWLLRAQLVGKKPRLRDGLYNAGAPIVSTVMLFLLLIIQLIPAALALVGYTTASVTGFLDNGAIAMTFFVVAALLVVLSLYLMTSTFFALVIVTLPGMYPWQALKTAGDLVLGRRFRIILRLFWMIVVIALTWAVIMIPFILLSEWLLTLWKGISWLPLIPISLTLMSSLTIVFISAYIYLLYRKMVDDGHTAR